MMVKNKRTFVALIAGLFMSIGSAGFAAEPSGEGDLQSNEAIFPRTAYPVFPGNDLQSDRVGSERMANLALKTNLLFDLLGAPNVGVEIPFGERFSMTVDAAHTSWTIDNIYALQTLQGGLGAKYWFNRRKGALTGWNIGIYGTYGDRYDVQWKDGYQGDEFWSAGLSGGYSMPIGRRLNLEMALAAGYFHTPEVRHYHAPEEGHLLWEETRYNVARFSLTKVQLNLVWLLGKRKK